MWKITVRINRARCFVAALALGHGTTMTWASTAPEGTRGRRADGVGPSAEAARTA
jgi:hypothetical protein